MKPKVLFVIGDDPRVSPRPAEAIRIAAGVGTWERVGVSLYLRDAAVLALSEQADELVDEENYVRYLPIVADRGHPVYVQQGSALLKELGQTSAWFEEIDDLTLAEIAANSDYVLRF